MKAKTVLLWMSFLCLSMISASDSGRAELFILDGHTHIGLNIDGKRIESRELSYYHRRGVDGIVFNLPVDRSKTAMLYERIEREMDAIKGIQSIGIAENAEDFINSQREQTFAVGFAIEYFYGIFGGDIKRVAKYSQLGIRTITLVHNKYDPIFKGKHLSTYGRNIIREMNRHGILIDITHLSDSQKSAVIRFSRIPVIASHANPRGGYDCEFNLSDAVLKLLRNRKGMVLLSINRNDLYAKGKTIAGPVAVFRHMDYLIRYLGEDRVGFGTDLQADGKYIPMDLQQEDCFQKIGGFMKEKGYSPQRIRKLMGRNYLDFLNEVAQLQKQLN